MQEIVAIRQVSKYSVIAHDGIQYWLIAGDKLWTRIQALILWTDQQGHLNVSEPMPPFWHGLILKRTKIYLLPDLKSQLWSGYARGLHGASSAA